MVALHHAAALTFEHNLFADSWTMPSLAKVIRLADETLVDRSSLPVVLQQRDPEFIRSILPFFAALADYYYRGEVEGLEHLRRDRSLLVSTHNGGAAFPDLYCFFVGFLRRFGFQKPLYGLVHKVVLHLPLLGSMLTRCGAIPATPDNARLVLREGFSLFVCPGGDEDALKPYSRRHEVVFGRRRGFIRLAIREQVPITPIVSVGAHETMLVLHDGQRMAQLLGLEKRFRLKTAPLTLAFPWGLTLGGALSVPLPSKVVVRVLPPIELDEPVEAADDAERVERCFNHVRDTMQRALTDLAQSRKRQRRGLRDIVRKRSQSSTEREGS